jgi:hypothetical protein
LHRSTGNGKSTEGFHSCRFAKDIARLMQNLAA